MFARTLAVVAFISAAFAGALITRVHFVTRADSNLRSPSRRSPRRRMLHRRQSRSAEGSLGLFGGPWKRLVYRRGAFHLFLTNAQILTIQSLIVMLLLSCSIFNAYIDKPRARRSRCSIWRCQVQRHRLPQLGQVGPWLCAVSVALQLSVFFDAGVM